METRGFPDENSDETSGRFDGETPPADLAMRTIANGVINGIIILIFFA
jgi:hypothetical protein